MTDIMTAALVSQIKIARDGVLAREEKGSGWSQGKSFSPKAILARLALRLTDQPAAKPGAG